MTRPGIKLWSPGPLANTSLIEWRHRFLLQGDTFAPYLFIICLDYVLRTSIDLMKENDFTLVKARSRRYVGQTIPLLANTPTQAESLQHSLELAAGGIGLHVNVDKTEFMCFNQRGDISTLNGRFLKLVENSPTLDATTHLRKMTSITRLAKAWTAIVKLLVIWKSDLSDKIKRK